MLCWPMFLQFAQQSEPKLELQRLDASAHSHFGASVTPTTVDPTGRSAQVHFETETHGSVAFTLRARLADDADRQRLEPAEMANRSYGMASLGRRCRCVWEVEPEPGASRRACYNFGALLAFVALGPFLPADGSGLYGVRSARLAASEP